MFSSFGTEFTRPVIGNSQKNSTIKKHHLGFLSSQNGSELDQKKQKKTKFLVRNHFYQTQAREFPKKQQKKFLKFKESSWLNFKLIQVGTGREREKIFSLFEIDFTRHELENSQKISKKNSNNKKNHPGFISSRNGFVQAEKVGTKFSHS